MHMQYLHLSKKSYFPMVLRKNARMKSVIIHFQYNMWEFIPLVYIKDSWCKVHVPVHKEANGYNDLQMF